MFKLNQKLLKIAPSLKFKGSGQNYFTCSGPTFWGGGLGKRPWVCTDRWGGWVRDHGSVQAGGGDG